MKIDTNVYREIDMNKRLLDLTKPIKDYIVYNYNPTVKDVEQVVLLGKVLVCKVSTNEEIINILDLVSKLNEKLKFNMNVFRTSLSNENFESWHLAEMEKLDAPNFWKPSAGFKKGTPITITMQFNYTTSTITDLPENLK